MDDDRATTMMMMTSKKQASGKATGWHSRQPSRRQAVNETFKSVPSGVEEEFGNQASKVQCPQAGTCKQQCGSRQAVMQKTGNDVI